jgi:hypothetical protein
MWPSDAPVLIFSSHPPAMSASALFVLDLKGKVGMSTNHPRV